MGRSAGACAPSVSVERGRLRCGARLPQAVFFDLDNTLVHRNASIDLYARRFWRDFGHVMAGGGADDAAAVIKRFDNGGYLPAGSPFASIKQAVSHGLQTELAWRRAPEHETLLAHWERYNAVCTAAMPGAAQAVAWLLSVGARIGVVSNGSHRTRLEKVAQLPFAAAIELTISSESAEVKKPDPAIFLMAADAMGVRPQDCWYVGDHPLNDAQGAMRAGMHPVWLQGFHPWPEDMPAACCAIPALEALAGLADA
ncbi:HAD family hydrolase [Chromobacterium sp. IIBBL 290-4]|uniref:HAD family hydrolase n=1 Tax=Chromobacterium sp. IIBBL 290-4 TaxID=2953890 RepID=UPI0020B8C81F|nr:HAD family hydrolase [Chromobacterium sp. IIBBL 290-4]UTH76221.1 HAD family hydrolase [Chromobacterium sp. IIBBL 290-4]